jgi:hypothetical protein
MSSAFDDFFNDNLVKICLNAKFSDLNCILGTSGMTISILLIAITIFGLFKLVKYYDSINFEISLFLFSILQIVLLDIIILIPHDFLFEIFFFIQMIHISLTIRKFLIIKRNNKAQCKDNFKFIILNIVNIVIFTFYLLSLLDILFNDYYLYIQTVIRFYYFIMAIILAFLCRSIITKIKHLEKANIDQIKEIDSNNSNTSNLFLSIKDNDWMFFLMREKQVKPLYILNLLCSFIQLIFILSKHFLLDGHFGKRIYKIKIQTNEGCIIYYIYITICFLNILVNYFCFYWVVRDQYKSQENETNKKKKKLLDENFIERQTIREQDEQKDIDAFVNDKSEKKKKKIKYSKSIYTNTFTEIDEDNDKEKYFIKEKDKEMNNQKDETFGPSDEETSGRATVNSNNGIINNSTANTANI